MAKIVELIYAEVRRGKGTEDDPVRNVKQLWTKSGYFVEEYDSFDKTYYEPGWAEVGNG